MALPLLFIASTLFAALLLLRATPDKSVAGGIIAGWLVIQGLIAGTGFYTVTNGMPPRIALALLPPAGFILALFLLKPGRAWMDRLDLRGLILLHVVRVPVEFGLHALHADGLVPQLITWEGRNFDIFSGVTAPLVALLAFRGGSPNRALLILWNLLCLALLVNVVFHGVLSVPTQFQRFGFEQPNTGLLLFPYVWLPSFIVPIVLLAHLAALRHLIRSRSPS